MSRDYHQGIYNFSNEFETSQQQQEQQRQHEHISQQIRREKLRIQGFEQESGIVLPVYETVGMLSEMFGFPPGGVSTATELLERQISQSYRNPRQHPAPPPPTGAASTADWFSHHQLLLMNSQRQRSPPSPSTTSTLHMLLPNHSSSTPSSNLQSFHTATGEGAFGQFTWVPNNEDHETNNNNPNDIVMEGQGLSLSLSSSLCLRQGGILSFGQGGGGSSNAGAHATAAAAAACLDMHGGVVSQDHQLHVGTSIGAVNILRNSKYAKPAQELLEEFCRVGRGQLKKNKSNPSSNPSGGAGEGGIGGGNSSSSSKDFHHLSAADRLEHQRRKVKLLSMLDEVDRRYSQYCEQMQMVANSFDMMMGFGAAVPYTCLAQKAMSRHFRCLKDAISAQLKQTCELLGEKDGGCASGLTKGETPKLKMLDQSLRQQRAYHQMGIMQQEAWRPQRGLPDRSVNILRAWLFEHFLHPYPSDADKHLLARQTGLSRNQVSNWFINARVRLWKPMVEEMYQQESKDDADPHRDHSGSTSTSTSASAAAAVTNSNNAHTSTPHEIIAPESDPSLIAINRQRFSENQANTINTNNNCTTSDAAAQSFPAMQGTGSGRHRIQPGNAAEVNESSTLIRFGANAGDVSLTLGLRHAGNLPEKSRFSVREFGGC